MNELEKWTDERLVPYAFDDEVIKDYILELIDKNKSQEAFKLSNLLIKEGKLEYASIVANKIFGIERAFENDNLWLEYMKKSISSNKISDIGHDERMKYHNDCGNWVAGHIDKNTYLNHMQKKYNISLKESDVKYAFLCKEDNKMHLSDEYFDFMLPITTANLERIV